MQHASHASSDLSCEGPPSPVSGTEPEPPIPYAGLLSAPVTGPYHVAVDELRKRIATTLNSQTTRSDTRLQVAVFGHGGWDSTLSLALLQAVSDSSLCELVSVKVHSCSWSDSTWEADMRSFLHAQKVPPELFALEVLKFGEELDVLKERIRRALKGAELVVECEQGVDLLVDPARSFFLADALEDHFVTTLCALHVEDRPHVPHLLIQTNRYLDQSRGVTAAVMDQEIFGGQRLDEALMARAAGSTRSSDARRALLDQWRDQKADPSPSNMYCRFMLQILQEHNGEGCMPVNGAGELLAWVESVEAEASPVWLVAGMRPGSAKRTGQELDVRVTASWSHLIANLLGARAEHLEKDYEQFSVDKTSRFLRGFWDQLYLAEAIVKTLWIGKPKLQKPFAVIYMWRLLEYAESLVIRRVQSIHLPHLKDAGVDPGELSDVLVALAVTRDKGKRAALRQQEGFYGLAGIAPLAEAGLIMIPVFLHVLLVFGAEEGGRLIRSKLPPPELDPAPTTKQKNWKLVLLASGVLVEVLCKRQGFLGN